MSRETIQWLNENTRIGYTDKRGPAWHKRAGATNHFPGPVPMDEVYKLFGFEAIESDVLYTVVRPSGVVQVTDPSRKLYYRSDTEGVLGIHGRNHRPHQYKEWLLNNVEILLGTSLQVGQCGLLRNGAVAWVSIEMEDTLKTSGIEFRPQLLAATSFDASIQTTMKLVSTIVVCDNTLAGGLSENVNTYKVKHSSGSKFDEDKARSMLGLVEAYAEQFDKNLDRMTHRKVTDAEFERFIQVYIPMPKDPTKRQETGIRKKQDIFRAYWQVDARVSPWRNTEFGVLQAANTWLHHDSTVKGAERAERNAWRAITAKKAESIEVFDRDVLITLGQVLATV